MLRVPDELKFSRMVADSFLPALSTAVCTNPVGLDVPLAEAMANISYQISQVTDESGLNRVPPTLISRMARGGKSTFLRHLFERIKCSRINGGSCNTMYITFNGQSNFVRGARESQSSAI